MTDSTKVYNNYAPEFLNKDSLLKEDDFIDDAVYFLTDRGGYGLEELETNEQVYDAYMEHFRYQNVNEVTALKDFTYIQDANVEDRERVGRLMDTFDKMDSDFGFTAAQDYLGGVFSAPSTYAGMFSFGAGKAGALAANQGIKLGIREAIKRGAKTTGLASVAIDAPVAAGTVAAQESIRVDTGIKDEIDMTNVALAAGLSTVASGTLGTYTGTRRAMTGFGAEEIAIATEKQMVAAAEKGNELSVKTLSEGPAKNIANEFLSSVEEGVKKERLGRLSLGETIPEELAEGKTLRVKQLNDAGKTLEQMEIENISAAAARIDDAIGDLPNLPKGKAERFTSRLVRGLANEHIDAQTFNKILEDHNVTFSQLGPLFAAEISRAASLMGTVSAAARKETYQNSMNLLNKLDDEMANVGDVMGVASAAGKQAAEEANAASALTKASNVAVNINKARIGLMTVQAATTVRNTTNGYMRNYIYTMDNMGAGIANIVKGKVKKGFNPTDAQVKAGADYDVRLGIAQLKTAGQSFFLKDMVLGTSSVSSEAFFRLLQDPKFGKNKAVQKLFRGMGDIGNMTGQEGGILGFARKANYFNTMSDNMFKRAIFAREVNKALAANPIKISDDLTVNNLNTLMKSGNFQKIGDDTLSDAMKEAFEFTYQTGDFKGREGAFNTLANGIIGFGSSVAGSTVIPFPRYLVNQFRFAYEHAPLVGMLNLGGILNKSGKTGKKGLIAVDTETIGKQLGGLTILGTFLGLREKFGNENTGAYDYKDPTSGGGFDAQASIGPFSAFALMADLLYRYAGSETSLGPIPKWHDNDKVTATIPYSSREMIKALTGGQGRAGTGLQVIDGFVQVLLEGEEAGETDLQNKENAIKFLGDYINTFTVGAGMLKDVVGTLDPEYRVLTDNTDVNFWEYFLKQSTRSIPATVGENFSGEREAAGSPIRPGPITRVNPFLKQITGLTPTERKTYTKEELDRLQFDYFEISPRKIKLDGPLSNDARTQMGKFMDRQVFAYLRSEEYRTIPTDKLKRYYLKKQVNKFRGLSRAMVMNPQTAATEESLTRLLRANWRSMSRSEKAKYNELYKVTYTDGNSIDEDEAFWFLTEGGKKPF